MIRMEINVKSLVEYNNSKIIQIVIPLQIISPFLMKCYILRI